MTDHRPRAYRIVEDDLTGAEVAALLDLHLAEMHRWSPACKVHAMPIERLRETDVTFYSAWDGDRLAAVGALKQLGAGRGELKSMRAAPAYRGRPEPFQPARRLYQGYGFAECPAFASYVSDEFSLCMERSL